jgi:energy-converting hydrogenase A subunit R
VTNDLLGGEASAGRGRLDGRCGSVTCQFAPREVRGMLLVAFDLEGPLSPQDNAYELMAIIPDGRRLFERLSRYDDLLALSGRPNYEPATPSNSSFLSCSLTESTKATSAKFRQKRHWSTVLPSVVQEIWAQGWQPCIVSTSSNHTH